jgi:N-acetylneuraminic acid mutarotase
LIYIPGGIGSDGAVTDTLEIYNPSQDSWTNGTPLPEPRCRYSLVALDGIIYLFGGWDGQSYQDDVYVYNPVENHWVTLTPMISARAWSGAAASGGRIYLFGGINDNGISDQVDVFSPPNPLNPSGDWSEGNSMPEKRYGFGATSLAELIFIVGGQGNGGTGVTDWVFYPEIDEWRSFPSPIKAGVIGQGVTGAGTHLYIAGGRVNNEIQNKVYTYQAFFTASLPIVR